MGRATVGDKLITVRLSNKLWPQVCRSLWRLPSPITLALCLWSNQYIWQVTAVGKGLEGGRGWCDGGHNFDIGWRVDNMIKKEKQLSVLSNNFTILERIAFCMIIFSIGNYSIYIFFIYIYICIYLYVDFFNMFVYNIYIYIR